MSSKKKTCRNFTWESVMLQLNGSLTSGRSTRGSFRGSTHGRSNPQCYMKCDQEGVFMCACFLCVCGWNNMGSECEGSATVLQLCRIHLLSGWVGVIKRQWGNHRGEWAAGFLVYISRTMHVHTSDCVHLCVRAQPISKWERQYWMLLQNPRLCSVAMLFFCYVVLKCPMATFFTTVLSSSYSMVKVKEKPLGMAKFC